VKKSYYIAIAIIVFLFLVARFFYLHIDGVKKEKAWYVKQLNYDFSGRIDSIQVYRHGNGTLFFHVIDGNPDNSVEKGLKRHLKYNGRLDFVFLLPNGGASIFIHHAKDYLPGDSLDINTDDNRVRIYRDGVMISEDKITDSMRGRPF
jgi:hypothetical protein